MFAFIRLRWTSLAAGHEVEVVGDAVSSRTAANRALGLERMQRGRARVTGVEMALFELLRTARARVPGDRPRREVSGRRAGGGLD